MFTSASKMNAMNLTFTEHWTGVLCFLFSPNFLRLSLIRETEPSWKLFLAICENWCFIQDGFHYSCEGKYERIERNTKIESRTHYFFIVVEYQKSLSHVWKKFSCLFDEGFLKICKKIEMSWWTFQKGQPIQPIWHYFFAQF